MSLRQESKRLQVVGIDDPCLDYLVEVEQLPGTNDEADIGKDSWQGGGMVPTALAALGRLGVPTGLIGVAGSDMYGEYCLHDLRKYDVDISHVVRDPGTSTDFCIAIAEKSTKGRSFITKWGNHRHLQIQDLDSAYISQAKYLHLCMEMHPVNAAAAEIAKASGVKVSIDADRYAKATEENLHLIDIFIASERYYRSLFDDERYEENCRRIQEKGPEIVIFTLGEKGCIGIGPEGFFALDAFAPGDIMDTTGAGDVFHGAFLKGLLEGYDTKNCARFASAVSAIKCLRLGGRAGIPDFHTTLHYLETGELLPSDFDEREAYYARGLGNLLSL